MSTGTDIAGAIVKRIVFDVVLKALLARIVTLVPFLALPVINPVFVFIATKLFEMYYRELELMGAYIVIDASTAHEAAKADEARDELKAAIEAPASTFASDKEKQDAIDKAKEEFRKRYADLIRMPKPGGVRRDGSP